MSEIEDTNSNVEYDVGFTGSDFNDTYYLDSLHFHWGEKAPNGVYTGSEHTIGHTLDGIQYPLEVDKKCFFQRRLPIVGPVCPTKFNLLKDA